MAKKAFKPDMATLADGHAVRAGREAGRARAIGRIASTAHTFCNTT